MSPSSFSLAFCWRQILDARSGSGPVVGVLFPLVLSPSLGWAGPGWAGTAVVSTGLAGMGLALLGSGSREARHWTRGHGTGW